MLLNIQHIKIPALIFIFLHTKNLKMKQGNVTIDMDLPNVSEDSRKGVNAVDTSASISAATVAGTIIYIHVTHLSSVTCKTATSTSHVYTGEGNNVYIVI